MRNIHKCKTGKAKVSMKLAQIANAQAYFLTIHVQNERILKVNYDISQSVCCLTMT